jgi:protein gp37
MGVNTSISWVHATFSPWTGCTRVSPGCDHCYAETLARRFPATFGAWGPAAPRKRAAVATWRAPLAWEQRAAGLGVGLRVFPSMCDPFDNAAPEAWRADLFALIAVTSHLDWLLLTKRPQNIRKMLPRDWGSGYANVWLGVSTENQAEADRRIPLLQKIPAAIRFLSVEPLLERVQLDLRGIHWAILGGESGPGARPMQLAWARDVRDQCHAARVALFVKQLGGRRDKGEDLSKWPRDLRVQEFPAATTSACNLKVG